MRPRTLIAIARRDLLQELRGRRGLGLIGITAAILLPISLFPSEFTGARAPRTYSVYGDVPTVVLAEPGVRVVDAPSADTDVLSRVATGFEAPRPDTPHLTVRARFLPHPIRSALDGDAPAVVVETVLWSLPRPKRSALFALISAAVLTGSVAESLAGERTRKTMDTLLTAAISRLELITGKWFAWSTYGALAAFVGAAIAIARGHLEVGPWLLPLPLTAATTVALDLWLLRHAKDVITGATTSIRFMPLAIAGFAVVAWGLGMGHPLLGAAVPLGGALMASGALWEGWAPALVASASALLATGLLLHRTAAALDQPDPLEVAPAPNWQRAPREAAMAALCWWPAIGAGLLWAPAGNRLVTAAQTPASYTAGAVLALLCWWIWHATALPHRESAAVRPAWVPAAAVGLAAGLLWGAAPPSWDEAGALWVQALNRLAHAQHPASLGLGLALLSAMAQELSLRGAVQRAVGPWWATAIAVAITFPHAPLFGLLWCGALSALAHRGGVGAAIAAHALAVGVSAALAWGG